MTRADAATIAATVLTDKPTLRGWVATFLTNLDDTALDRLFEQLLATGDEVTA
jgi:hypothetical protein